MSDPAAQAPARPAQTLKPNQVLIGGKVLGTRIVNKQVYTHIVLPAPDEYSSPSHVEIVSAKRIANSEDQILQLCALGGYLGKQFDQIDKETGEKSSRRPVMITLRAIEKDGSV